VVSYSLVSGPCTLNVATLTGTGAGSCIVTATKAADNAYASATSSQDTVVVSLAPQATFVVVPTPGSINVNGTSTLSTTGGSGSGAVSYSLVSGPCTLSGATFTGTAAGSCSVTATKAADHAYASATSSPVTVTVSGPPPVTNLVATPGPGYIRLTFTTNSPALASRLQPRTAMVYTGTCSSSNGGVTASATGTGSPLTVAGTTAGKSYSCVVTGSDGSGTSSSATSNVVTPTAAPPPIPRTDPYAE
jgi:trimeric autotransporter adhesin